MANPDDMRLNVAIALVVLYVGAGGVVKLASVPYVRGSFPKLGSPGWFGYFIGTCEVPGCAALPIRPLRAPAAAGIGIIMIGATWYHALFTPLFTSLVQAAPAFILLLLCVWISSARCHDLFGR